MSNHIKSLSAKITRLAQSSKVSTTPNDIFRDLVQMGFNLLFEGSMVNLARPRGGISLEQKSYYRELSHYKNDLHAWAELQELFLDYMEAVAKSEPFADILNEVFSEHANFSLAQYFTPPDVANALVAMQLGDGSVSQFMERGERFSVGDPTGCGTGTMLLAVLRYLNNNHGEEALKLVELVANDLDPLMCMATILQIELSSIVHNKKFASFLCFNGNALKEEQPLFYFSVPDVLLCGNEKALLMAQMIYGKKERNKVANDEHNQIHQVA